MSLVDQWHTQSVAQRLEWRGVTPAHLAYLAALHAARHDRQTTRHGQEEVR